VKIRLLVLLSLALLHCAEAPTQAPAPEVAGTTSVEVEGLKVLRVGSTTPLSIDPSSEGWPENFKPAPAVDEAAGTSPGEGSRGVHTTMVEPTHPIAPPQAGGPTRPVSYAWQASAGRISGHGASVTFTAPDHPDTVNVVVLVKESDGTTMTGATTIIVFQQWVILKADDFRYAPAGTISPGWRRFIDFVESRKIRASIGLIGVEIERGDGAFADTIHDLASNPRIEFWNHGYDHLLNVTDDAGHTVSEFRGTSYEHQLEHMQRTQTLARERCGIVLHAFGAPGNAFDSNTARAVDACDDLRIWFFGAPYSNKLVLPYTVAIEQPIFQPSESGFMAAYDPAPPCATYQIHPKDWDPARFAAFTRIIDFLIARDVTFTTPSDFEQISQKMVGGR
jgi:peptidoglycan/xylan/chitin deacetylase (PgdA/CDA1 family)